MELAQDHVQWRASPLAMLLLQGKVVFVQIQHSPLKRAGDWKCSSTHS
jgi:hypothetical protein